MVDEFCMQDDTSLLRVFIVLTDNCFRCINRTKAKVEFVHYEFVLIVCNSLFLSGKVIDCCAKPFAKPYV